MSETKTTINRMARDLSAWLRILPKPRRALTYDWSASLTLGTAGGEPVMVEAWFLGGHFLVKWVEWSDLVNRWSRCYGLSGEDLPGRWYRLHERCKRLAEHVLASESLAALVTPAWEPDVFSSPFETRDRDIAETFYALVRQESIKRAVVAVSGRVPLNDVRLPDRPRLIESSSGLYERGEGYLIDDSPPPSQDEWASLAPRMVLIDAGQSTPLEPAEEIRDALAYHIRRYRSTMLQFSWLAQTSDWINAYTRWTRDGWRTEMNWINEALRKFENADHRGSLEAVLGRLAVAIGEMGYEEFGEMVADRDFLGGADSPVGRDGINLIPSSRKGACASILVAVSKGNSKKSPMGFPKIMQRVKTHLIECAGITKAAVVLCDTWDAAAFTDEHFDELRAHYRRGVRFVFLVAGAPGRSLSPLAVDLDETK